VCLKEYVTFNRSRHTTTFDVIVHHFWSYTGRRVVIWCQFTEVRQNGTFYREDLSDCDRLNELNKAFINNIPDNGLYSLWNQSITQRNQKVLQANQRCETARTRSTVHCKQCQLDWIEHCFTSPPTQYRLYGRRFLQTKPTVSKY